MPAAESEVLGQAPAILIHVAPIIETIDTIVIIDLPLQLWNIFRQMASEMQLLQQRMRPQPLNEGHYIIVRLIFLLCNVQKILLCNAKPACPIMICPQAMSGMPAMSAIMATITTTITIIIT